MAYNVHDVLRRVVIYYTRKKKFKKSIFGYDLKLLSFLKMKHKIYKELTHFQNFIFIQNYKQKKCHLPKKFYTFFITICKKNNSNIHSYEKIFLGKNTCNPILK
jgi:hypothetical protein